jgi:hypothetical protein
VISEVLGNAEDNGTVFDTGGELIGIGELVEVTRIVNKPTSPNYTRPAQKSIEPDNYYLEIKFWNESLNESHIDPATICEQVQDVTQSLNKWTN